jgi:hypothetical protein
MTSLLKAIRGSIAYVAAGACQGRRDHPRAIAKIEDAKRLIGKSLQKPQLFYIYLRAAHIYFDAEILHESRENLTNAIKAIKRIRHIDDIDRDYLLDYCDLLLADIIGDRGAMRYRVHGECYRKVSSRYRREYPIIWHDSGLR